MSRPTSPHYEYPISAVPGRTPLVPQGPLVLPGTYTVRLTVDGQTASQPLTVKMDPRIRTSPADLETLHAAEVALYDSLNQVAGADLAAHSVEEQIEAKENASIASQLQPYEAELKKLLQGSGRAGAGQAAPEETAAQPEPTLDDVTAEAGQLYSEMDQADEPATQTLLSNASHIEQEAKSVVPQWEAFRTNQLPKINAVLRQAGRPAVDLQKPAENVPGGGDEE